MNKIKSKYRVGDIITLQLSYSISIYRVDSITVNDKSMPYYNLIGLGEIEQLDNGENKYRTETRRYNPFIHYLDKVKISRKASKVEKLLFAKEVVCY